MISIKGACPVCGVGAIGFRLCSDGTTLVVMCDECDSIWTSLRSVGPENPIYLEAAGFLVTGMSCSISSPRVTVGHEK